jgi:hypothetical protein
MMEQKKNIFEALGIFIINMRSVFHALCLREFGENWETSYSETFRHDSNRDLWNNQIRNGEKPENLIDFGNLEMFAERHRQSNFFRQRFINDNINYRIPTYFKDIADVRNSLMHFQHIDDNQILRAYINMQSIANALEMDELAESLNELRNNTNREESKKTKEQDTNKKTYISSETLRRDKSNSHNNAERLFSNTEIQIEITKRAQTLSDIELNKLCDRDYSKNTFNNTYAIFVKVPQNASKEERQLAIKDHNNTNRWTVRYEFNRNNYSYFITTQWYPRNDAYVEDWLQLTNSKLYKNTV